LTSCQNHRLESHERKIIEFLKQNPEDQSNILVIDTISAFEWDEMIVAGPYSYFDEIERETAYELNDFSTKIEGYDSVILLGFFKNKKGVQYMEIPIELLPNTLFDGFSGNYKFYDRKNSNLNLRSL